MNKKNKLDVMEKEIKQMKKTMKKNPEERIIEQLEGVKESQEVISNINNIMLMLLIFLLGLIVSLLVMCMV